MEQADPTSPWHPASAPEMDALRLYSAPMAAAVSRYVRIARRRRAGSAATSGCVRRKCRPTAGMIPAAPFVGAVTTRRPSAFSSLTAIAKAWSHSIVVSAPRSSASSRRSRCARARRRTLSRPGRTPSRSSPASTHALIVSQMRSTPASTSAAGRSAVSLAQATAAMDVRSRSHTARSSAALANGNGTPTGSVRGSIASPASSAPTWAASFAAAASSSAAVRTNPPPTE
ncbi:Uncharacterised protein [Mycobacteroides abscessus]|nr:Uncharacterised protein [Mycobacteroides abscessus]